MNPENSQGYSQKIENHWTVYKNITISKQTKKQIMLNHHINQMYLKIKRLKS